MPGNIKSTKLSSSFLKLLKSRNVSLVYLFLNYFSRIQFLSVLGEILIATFRWFLPLLCRVISPHGHYSHDSSPITSLSKQAHTYIRTYPKVINRSTCYALNNCGYIDPLSPSSSSPPLRRAYDIPLFTKREGKY